MKTTRKLKLSIALVLTLLMIAPAFFVTPVSGLPLSIWWTAGDTAPQCGEIEIHIMLSDPSQVGQTFVVGRYLGWTVENWGQVTMGSQHADVVLNVPCNAPLGPGLDIQARSGWSHTSSLIEMTVTSPSSDPCSPIPWSWDTCNDDVGHTLDFDDGVPGKIDVDWDGQGTDWEWMYIEQTLSLNNWDIIQMEYSFDWISNSKMGISQLNFYSDLGNAALLMGVRDSSSAYSGNFQIYGYNEGLGLGEIGNAETGLTSGATSLQNGLMWSQFYNIRLLAGIWVTDADVKLDYPGNTLEITLNGIELPTKVRLYQSYHSQYSSTSQTTTFETYRQGVPFFYLSSIDLNQPVTLVEKGEAIDRDVWIHNLGFSGTLPYTITLEASNYLDYQVEVASGTVYIESSTDAKVSFHIDPIFTNPSGDEWYALNIGTYAYHLSTDSGVYTNLDAIEVQANTGTNIIYSVAIRDDNYYGESWWDSYPELEDTAQFLKDTVQWSVACQDWSTSPESCDGTSQPDDTLRFYLSGGFEEMMDLDFRFKNFWGWDADNIGTTDSNISDSALIYSGNMLGLSGEWIWNDGTSASNHGFDILIGLTSSLTGGITVTGVPSDLGNYFISGVFDANDIAVSRLILIHELSHLFGADDNPEAGIPNVPNIIGWVMAKGEDHAFFRSWASYDWLYGLYQPTFVYYDYTYRQIIVNQDLFN